MKQTEPPVFSVSQITSLIKETLEGGFRSLSVEGEVSNYRPALVGTYLLLPEGSGGDDLLCALSQRRRKGSL